MGDKGHFFVSLGKSFLRIWSCLFALITCRGVERSIIYLAIGFGIAEILGILEEFADKRK